MHKQTDRQTHTHIHRTNQQLKTYEKFHIQFLFLFVHRRSNIIVLNDVRYGPIYTLCDQNILIFYEYACNIFFLLHHRRKDITPPMKKDNEKIIGLQSLVGSVYGCVFVCLFVHGLTPPYLSALKPFFFCMNTRIRYMYRQK